MAVAEDVYDDIGVERYGLTWLGHGAPPVLWTTIDKEYIKRGILPVD
jgi:hypothetical protein